MVNLKRFVGIFSFLLVVVLLQAPQPVRSSRNTASPAAQVLGITLGVQQPPTINYGTEISNVNSLTGKNHGIVLFYVDWSTTFASSGGFLQQQIDNQMTVGARPIIMLAWEPASGQQTLGCDQNYTGAVPWSTISSGLCDTYIRNYATAIKARSERFLIKFAHEMNGGGTPWSPINVGVNPSGFVTAWQHIHNIFASQGVTNVEWVWAPIFHSNPNTTMNDVHNYYPGDNYVDWVAVSGYNYYNQLPGAPQPWETFSNIFDATLRDFACHYGKPQLIHEFASVEDYSGTNSKSAWIADAYLQAQNYPFLRGVVWYNDSDSANPNADFRITTSTSGNPPYGTVQPLPIGSGAWTNAYKNAAALSIYISQLPPLQQVAPPGPYCGDGSTSLTVQNFVLARPGDQVKLSFQGWNYANTLNFSLGLPAGITGSVLPTSLPAPWGKANVTLNVGSSVTLGTYNVTLHTGAGDLPIQVQVVSTIYNLFLPTVLR